jgi:hypothetical protein
MTRVAFRSLSAIWSSAQITICILTAVGSAQAAPLVFNSTTPVNDLQGSFAAQISFAQSQIIPARPREGDVQPHLIGKRKCLVLVRPLTPNEAIPVSITARDGAGKVLGSFVLNSPKQLPKTAYHIDGAPDGPIDFTPGTGSTSTLRDRASVEKLGDATAALLRSELQRHSVVEIETADGRWVRDIYLPPDKAFTGDVVRVRSQAGYPSTVHYSSRSVPLSRGQELLFKCIDGQWFRDGDLDNNALTYSVGTWSGLLPGEWIAPGLTLQFRQGSFTGELSRIKVGAPTQLLIHTIDIGMLTSPRGAFEFAKNPEAHREYYQTAPINRLIVAQYAPLTLTEVMMPTGTLLTDLDPSEGGWHTGMMRQFIGKELVSHGIDNANYGLNSTSGQGERSHPYVVAQLTAHNNRGNYSNGIQVHGGSGGGGIVTLDQSLGNEFSHEVGHNYGLGHYVDGFKGSVHRAADQVNSTWGWDADKFRFIPNFFPVRSGKETTLDGQSQPPFDGRSYGLDAMAGGQPFSNFNRFTLYTPNTAAIIQRFVEGKAVFDAASPTGFSKWNADSAKMEPYKHTIDVTREINAPIKDLEESSLTSLLANYELVTIAMSDGNWTRDIPLPAASAANRNRTVAIRHGAAYGSVLTVNGERVPVATGFNKSYLSDGRRWNEGPIPDRAIPRKPRAFGVPVVTLVGYYDPTAQLKSYIYPPLHGAYGFCYNDDATAVAENDCQLQIETATGVLRFKLAGYRLGGRYMNKFHVNVPASTRPRSVSVVCNGRVLDRREIAPTTEKLGVTVNGVPTASPR